MSTKALRRWEDLKDKIDELTTRRDRAIGALDEQKKILKEKFGCDSIKAGLRYLEKLKAEEAEASELFSDQLEAFERDFGELLDSEDKS